MKTELWRAAAAAGGRFARRGLLSWSVVALIAAAGCETNNQGYEPVQPIAYSHAVHAGTSRINCEYCHFGAERGRYAGIPPVSICMNCHEQVLKENEEVLKLVAHLENREPIEWVRVHQLPDHVYFDHSAHVVTGGLECQTCHGPVESMGLVRQESPLTMGWCVSCHRTEQPPIGRDPTLGVAAAELGDLAVQPAFPVIELGTAPATRLTDCSVCHR